VCAKTQGRSAGSCTAAIFLREFVPGLTPEVNATEIDESLKDSIRFAHIGKFLDKTLKVQHPLNLRFARF
jgi:hypothetical protein